MLHSRGEGDGRRGEERRSRQTGGLNNSRAESLFSSCLFSFSNTSFPPSSWLHYFIFDVIRILGHHFEMGEARVSPRQRERDTTL